MRRWRPGLEWRTSSSPPVRVGERTITLRSTALTLRAGNAAFVWNRPASVDVEEAGIVRRVRIVDQGRLAWLGVGGVLLLLLLILAAAPPGKERVT